MTLIKIEKLWKFSGWIYLQTDQINPALDNPWHQQTSLSSDRVSWIHRIGNSLILSRFGASSREIPCFLLWNHGKRVFGKPAAQTAQRSAPSTADHRTISALALGGLKPFVSYWFSSSAFSAASKLAFRLFWELNSSWIFVWVSF